MTAFEYDKQLEELAYEDEYNSWCIYSETKAMLDSEYGYPTVEASANTRNDKNEIIETNGPHPNNNGYK